MQLQTLCEKCAAEASAASACVSLLVQDIACSQPLLEHDAQRQLVSASTIKTQIMLTTLDMVQHGTLSLQTLVPISSEDILPDSTAFDRPISKVAVEELLHWMICISDNTATNLLIRLVGMEAVNRYSAEILHLTATKLERKMLDWDALQQGRNNFTSPHDMLRTYRALAQKTILTPELCDYALSVLSCQQDKTVAFRYIWEPLRAAHKTGGLDGLDHDTGLLFFQNHTYFFGFFATNGSSNTENQQLLGRLFRMIIDYLKEVEA